MANHHQVSFPEKTDRDQEIREQYEAGVSINKLVSSYGISMWQVNQIIEHNRVEYKEGGIIFRHQKGGKYR